MYLVSTKLRQLSLVTMVLAVSACQTLNKKAKYYSTEITLRNGSVLKGSTSPIANDSFSFIDAQTSKKSTIKNKDVVSAIKHTTDGAKEYAQFEIQNRKKQIETVLAAYEVKGELSLIAREATEHVRQTKDINNRMTFVNETLLVKRLYLKLPDAPGVEVPIGKRKAQEKDFADVALSFFADAPTLMNKIGSPGYEGADIRKIVEEYNSLKAKNK